MEKSALVYIVLTLVTVGFGFCVRKGRTEMLNRLNKAIASMQADGTENKLKVEWMGTAD